MVKEDKVLVVRRISVRYRLAEVPDELRDAAIRAHEHHARFCPVARTITPCVEIDTQLELV